MKVLLLYDYPPSPSGLATQGDLLLRGLVELGVEAYAVNCESAQEKEWYYRWLKPDIVVGIGFWGHTPQLILHPQNFGVQPVPWLVAGGYIADYQSVLNDLPLILVTSAWVKEMYVRDGISPDNIVVLPVGCDTDSFIPHPRDNYKISAVRDSFGVTPSQLMLLTAGGDAASKGAREVMQALALIDKEVPDYKYVCKVWPQARTKRQNIEDLLLAKKLGIEKRIVYGTFISSRNFMPYLLGACDIYAGPSRLEGFGMLQVEAGACGKPVVSMQAMGMLDTLIHGETAFLASVAEKIVVDRVETGDDNSGGKRMVLFDVPRTVDYRADVGDIAAGLLRLMNDPALCLRMGAAGRDHVVDHFDYRLVARKFVEIVGCRLGIS